VGRSVARCP